MSCPPRDVRLQVPLGFISTTAFVPLDLAKKTDRGVVPLSATATQKFVTLTVFVVALNVITLTWLIPQDPVNVPARKRKVSG
jgi:hypothetical protein